MTWAQIETLANAYLHTPHVAQAERLDASLRESQTPIDTFCRLFIQPLKDMQETKVAFQFSENGAYPSWSCHFDSEKKTFFLNAIGVLLFKEECRHAGETAKTQQGRGSFTTYRYLAYLQELQKLPLKYLFLLCLFKEVASVMGVTQSDKRNLVQAPLNDSEQAYMDYQWAFKTLENAVKTLSHTDIRAEYKISWYDSEWIAVHS